MNTFSKRYATFSRFYKNVAILFFAFFFLCFSYVSSANAEWPTNEKYPGTLLWPLDTSYRNVSSEVGARWGKNHTGTDICGMPRLTPVVAAEEGTAYRMWYGGYGIGSGNYILIDHHNGYYTRYAHLAGYANCLKGSENAIAEVTRGQVIGYVGLTGKTDGTHLHFEILKHQKGCASSYSSSWLSLRGAATGYNKPYQSFDYQSVSGGSDISDLEIRNVYYPKTFVIGKGFALQGGFACSKNGLKTLGAWIVDSQGNVISHMADCSNDRMSISGKAYEIQELDGKGKDLGNKFSLIQNPGEYQWILEATDNSGKTVTLIIPFTAVKQGKDKYDHMSSYNQPGAVSYLTGISIAPETPLSGVYVFKRNNDCRSGPGESYDKVSDISKGTIVFVVASTKSEFGYTWYKLSDGSFVWSGDVDEVTLTETAVSDKYRVKRTAKSHVWPYNASDEADTYAVGTIVKVVAKVVNTDNSLWYKMANGTYVQSGNLEAVTSEVDELQFIDVQHPVNYHIGSSNGYILTDGTLASNNELVSITTSIKKSDGTTVSGPVTKNISGYSYAIKNLDTFESNDNGVKFSKITTSGSYIWELTAKDGGDNSLTMEMPFTASSGSTSSKSSSKKFSDVDRAVASLSIALGENDGEAISASYYGYDEDSALQLYAQVMPTNASNPSIKWTSSNEKVLKFTSSESMDEGGTIGHFTRTGVGSAVITAAAQDGSGKKATLAYDYYISSISLQPSDAQISVGQDTTVASTIVPHVASNKDISWESMSPWIATVDSTGKVHGVSAGSAVITATAKAGGIKGICTINVMPISVEAVWLNEDDASLEVGSSFNLDYLIYPSDAGNQEVTWTSSNPAVASVDVAGRVTAIGEGVSEITVTTADGGKTDQCIVNVVSTGPRGIWGTLNWTLVDGVLTISGSGDMDPFMLYDDSQAWRRYRYDIDSVVIQDGITSISYYAFGGCNLRSISIPESITQIGGCAFYCCDYLTDVSIPTGVTNVEDWTFGGCSNLMSIIIPEGTTRIGEYAFYGCNGLQSVSIPQSVTEIGEEAFSLCNDNIKMTVAAHSAGADYALENGLQCAINGTWGNLTWKLEKDYDHSTPWGELWITGSGSMNDFSYGSMEAWLEYKDEINTVYCRSGVTNISCHAFGGCSNLRSIDIRQSSITSLDDWAIYDCGALNNINIWAVNKIGKRVFSNCSKIDDVSLNSLERIEDYAFSNCINLKKVSFGDNVNYIGTGAFSDCPNITMFTVGRDTYAMEYAIAHGIPYRYSGNWWGDLQWTFYTYYDENEDDYYDLKIFGTGKMNDFSESTREGWQSKLSGLDVKDIIINDGVTSIGAYAFRDCNVRTIRIPQSVTSIGPCAFCGSTIERLTIPSSVTSIDPRAFDSCYVTNLSFADGAFSYENGILISASQATLVSIADKNLTTYTIPENVTRIGSYAFEHCSIESITIPQNVTIIDEGAFSRCVFLRECIIPDGVSRINKKTFYQCQKLTNVSILGNVTSIDDEAFANCYNMEEFEIPESVTRIGNRVFYGSYSLRRVIIPDSVTSIGDNAFRYCNDDLILTVKPGSYAMEYAIENGIAYYVDESYNSYGKIGNIYWSLDDDGTLSVSGQGNIADFTNGSNVAWHPYRSLITNIVIHDGVTGVGSRAFSDCANLVNISLPSSLTAISSNSFRNCGALKSITIPGSVVTIGEDAFGGCRILDSINVDDGNDNFTSVDGVLLNKAKDTIIFCPSGLSGMYFVPEGVINIGYKAFYGCGKLTGIAFAESLMSIESWAFGKCNNLQDVSIPEMTQQIGQSAFSGCSNLRRITISQGVTFIGESVFNGCSRLKSINVDPGNNVYSSVDGVLFNKSVSALLSYPAGKAETSYTIPSSVTSIGEKAFSNCDNLNRIMIGKNINIISSLAVEKCDSLTIVCYKDSTAHSYAISNNIPFILMDSLLKTANFIIPASMNTIEEEAFSSIDAKWVKLPENIIAIGKLAFAYCLNLQGIYIPDNCISISSDAFYGDTGLLIFGHKGSYAESYASINGIEFIAIDTE